jgi:hypothetical protein
MDVLYLGKYVCVREWARCVCQDMGVSVWAGCIYVRIRV